MLKGLDGVTHSLIGDRPACVGWGHPKDTPGLGQVEGAGGWVCAQQWRVAGLGLMPWEVGKGTVVTWGTCWAVALAGA